MIYFVTALFNEAKPIIERYKMKKLTHIHVFQVFKGQDSLLTISGVGGISCAACAARLFTLFPPEAEDIVINIGICGSYGKISIGQRVLCNKIIDMTNGRKFYPDMLFKHPFEEGVLESHPAVVNLQANPKGSYSDIVDMEGASFYQVSANFFPSHRIFVLKVVSDFLDPAGITKNKIQELIEYCMDEIFHWLSTIAGCRLEERFAFTEEELETIGQVTENLKLSVTMGIHFQKLAKNYKIRNDTFIDVLKPYCGVSCSRKEDRKNYYEALSRELTQ